MADEADAEAAGVGGRGGGGVGRHLGNGSLRRH